MSKLAGFHILVVEDEPALRDMMVDEFAFLGAAAVGAENGEVAFALLRDQPFDAVISDLRMPGGDGLYLMKRIQTEISPKPKLFLCTGFHQSDELKGLSLDEVFTKPFNWDYVADRITQALRPEA